MSFAMQFSRQHQGLMAPANHAMRAVTVFTRRLLAAHHGTTVSGTTWRESTPLDSTKLSPCLILVVDSRAVSSGATTLLRCCTTQVSTLSGTTLFGAKIPAELLIS